MSSWNKARLAVAASAIALLSACAAVGPNFQSPAAPATGSYAMAGDAASKVPALGAVGGTSGDWWTAFGSAELDRTIKQALTDSPTLAVADATLQQARAAAFAERPTIDGSFNASVQRTRINLAAYGIPGFPSPTVNQYVIGGNISYDIDLFGGLRRTTEDYEARAQAEEQRARAAYLTLSGKVAMAAVRIATLRAEIASITLWIAAISARRVAMRTAAMATLPLRVR